MLNQNYEIKFPRILIISNNSFSDITNNGKTLASFFDDYPTEKIAQLYFNAEIPGEVKYNNFFRITDREVFNSVFKRDSNCGKKISKELLLQNEKSYKSNNLVNKLKKNNLVRIFREALWRKKTWKTVELTEWLDDFSPQIIFFCAGDSGFAYDITKYIQQKYSTKTVVYITDDYILPRRTLSVFWWIRRKKIFNEMKYCIKRSDLFITISQEMKEIYRNLFGVDSYLAINMTDSMKIKSELTNNDEKISLIYAGGLHFKRYETLFRLAKSLEKYNNNPINKYKAHLKIYSSQEPNKAIKKKLNIKGVSEFSGKLNSTQLKEALNSSDIPVHVESFDKKSIASTRLSISTKIPEYLSLGKPILAIGPKNLASMKYLANSAYCITSKKNLYPLLEDFLNNDERKKILSTLSLNKYHDNHLKENVSKNLLTKIIEIL